MKQKPRWWWWKKKEEEEVSKHFSFFGRFDCIQQAKYVLVHIKYTSYVDESIVSFYHSMNFASYLFLDNRIRYTINKPISFVYLLWVFHSGIYLYIYTNMNAAITHTKYYYIYAMSWMRCCVTKTIAKQHSESYNRNMERERKKTSSSNRRIEDDTH